MTGERVWTPEYATWVRMRQRCNNKKNPDYHYYGKRGIQICKRWDSFLNFLTDLGERPTSQHSLDRIDVNGDYKPSNCRWATKLEQSRNRRDTVYYKKKPLKELCEQFGVPFPTAYERLRNGHDPFIPRLRSGTIRKETYAS